MYYYIYMMQIIYKYLPRLQWSTYRNGIIYAIEIESDYSRSVAYNQEQLIMRS